MTTSAVIQPAIAPAPGESPFGAVVARQLSVWPFAARTARLFVLVDPSVPDEQLRQGLLRAMQHGYFASDGYSQTRAVREAALAAHYVLQHHNRDVLPLHQVNAASAVAAVRGGVAFVALAGDAAAFAWREGELFSQHGVLRLPRPLGLDQDPPITLWRTPLAAGDRLVLVCGATWHSDSDRKITAILSSTTSTAAAQRELATALGGRQPAGVQVIAPSTPRLHVPHLRLVTPAEPSSPAPVPARKTISPVRLLFPALGLLLLTLLTVIALVFVPQPSTLAAPTQGVTPHVAVSLGPEAANVVDMVAGASALYTLDVAEGAVHAFALDALDQQPTPDTVLARAGTRLDSAGHALTLPIAIDYLPLAGSLAIVDQSRAIVQIGGDRGVSISDLPTSASWQELGALGAADDGRLLFLDGRAGRLLAYPVADGQLVDAPDLVLDDASLSSVPFQRVAQVLTTSASVVLRLDDGSLHAVDAAGTDQPIALSSPVSAIAPDRAGGLFLADPLGARILQARLDGSVLRVMEAPALAGVRAIDVSLDGQRLYALVESGILVIDLPQM